MVGLQTKRAGRFVQKRENRGICACLGGGVVRSHGMVRVWGEVRLVMVSGDGARSRD